MVKTILTHINDKDECITIDLYGNKSVSEMYRKFYEFLLIAGYSDEEIRNYWEVVGDN